MKRVYLILFLSLLLTLPVSLLFGNEIDEDGYLVVPRVENGSITMDGQHNEAAWSEVLTSELSDSSTIFDYYALFGVLHDDDYLYLYFKITDDWLDFQKNTWNTDAVEIYVDGDNSKMDTWDNLDDYQVTCPLGADSVAEWAGEGPTEPYPRENIVYGKAETVDGWDAEIALPKYDFMFTEFIGFDIALNDADDTGAREDQIWFQDDGAWNDPSSWGDAILVDEMVGGGGGNGDELPEPNSFFDFEGDGLVVKDQGTAGNDGEIVGDWIARDSVGVVTKEGEGRGCLWWYEENGFGELSYVLVPYADYMNSPNYTLSTWMMYTGAEPNWGYLFWADGDWWEPDIQDRHIDVWLNPNNKGVDCILHDVEDGELRVATTFDETGIDVYDGAWHQVTVTLEDNSYYSIYLDGVWAADGEAAADIVTNVGDDMWLGARPNDADAITSVKIVGMMDRVRMWDQALNPEQIEYLFLMEGPEGGSVDVKENGFTPQEFKLVGNYPNPFNPATTIQYSLQTTEKVTLEIFDVLGNKITTLVSGVQHAGEHRAQWNGRDDSGQLAASGVYFYRLTAGEQVSTRKMMLMK